MSCGPLKILRFLFNLRPFSLTAISTLYFVEHQPAGFQKYGFSYASLSGGLKKSFDLEAGFRGGSIPGDITTTIAAKSFKPTRRQPAVTDGTELSEEFNKANRWPPDEAEDVELSSNSIIDGAQYNKKNESKYLPWRTKGFSLRIPNYKVFKLSCIAAKTYTEPVVGKNLDLKNKNLYNFKGPGTYALILRFVVLN